eukprot:TRINITY_DN6657_c0_g1_i2.p1 TRINITY_DN6657_c0_g1~~TRINITY_DN6657_c0_g1_i2.p1  ORF type:complete len:120 (-),score=34.43 TRINITY_DN6657_c0_g1_i2:21-380(-)
MRDQYYHHGQGFLLVYSITSRTSFDEISGFREGILRAKDADKVPIVLCATKCDLEAERRVSRVEGSDLARSWGCPFLETSARTRTNVDESFFELVREIRRAFPAKKKGKIDRNKQCLLL